MGRLLEQLYSSNVSGFYSTCTLPSVSDCGAVAVVALPPDNCGVVKRRLHWFFELARP